VANDILSTRASAPPGRQLEDLALQAAVEDALASFLASEGAVLTALDPALEPLVSTTREAVLGGGKRLRPTFAYWGWRGVVGPAADPNPVIPALAALELLHTFALVHDDIMDGSATRRGRPTAHRAFAAAHSRDGLRGEAGDFGTAAAILVGDLCLVWADQLMALAELPAEAVAAARRCYDRMRVEAIAGQFLDVLSGYSEAWPLESALRTARLKTASYTVIRPLHYGAALGDPPGTGFGHGRLRQAYTRYGLAVGEAFQLSDDLLGVFGDPALTGKPVGEDAAQRKPTVLLQLARARANRSQALELERLLRAGPAVDMLRLAALVEETGAAARLGQMITERVTDALWALDRAPIHPQVRSALTELAGMVAWRTA
jgi:geranylgeranyl diphosphate synthase type I